MPTDSMIEELKVQIEIVRRVLTAQGELIQTYEVALRAIQKELAGSLSASAMMAEAIAEKALRGRG